MGHLTFKKLLTPVKPVSSIIKAKGAIESHPAQCSNTAVTSASESKPTINDGSGLLRLENDQPFLLARSKWQFSQPDQSRKHLISTT